MPMQINYDGLPEHLREGVQLYIEHGIEPGGFLTGVICNQLKQSFMCADDINIHRMLDIVNFFYNQAPMGCWGSPEAMKQWIEHKRAEKDG